jgi:hypothetical protein
MTLTASAAVAAEGRRFRAEITQHWPRIGCRALDRLPCLDQARPGNKGSRARVRRATSSV